MCCTTPRSHHFSSHARNWISWKMATSQDNAAHRTVIEFCAGLEMTPVLSHKHITFVEKHRNVFRTLVYKLHHRYSHDEKENKENKQPGRKKNKTELLVILHISHNWLKENLRGQRFNDRKELMSTTLRFNMTLNKEWFRGVYNGWIKWHRFGIACHGEYFETERSKRQNDVKVCAGRQLVDIFKVLLKSLFWKYWNETS